LRRSPNVIVRHLASVEL